MLGLMPILPEHFFAGRDFEASTLDPLIGSGPYRFQEIKPGERVIYRRDPHWWGRGLAVNRGLWNFDEVRFDYFSTAMRRSRPSSGDWSTFAPRAIRRAGRVTTNSRGRQAARWRAIS